MIRIFAKTATVIAQAPIRFYRFAISPLIGSRCRFHPTCSAYALEALEKHGFFAGIFLTLKRIGKCHPYCTAEWHDPVPNQFTKPAFFSYKRKQHYKQTSGKAVPK